jgi:hypothetical protein
MVDNNIRAADFATPEHHAAYLRAREAGRVHVHAGSVFTAPPPAAAPGAGEAIALGQRAVLLRLGDAEALRLHSPLQLASAGGGLPSTFKGTAYSGGLVPDFGVVIDMATTTYNARLPLLNSHMRSDVVGVIEQAAERAGAMIVAGRLFSDMPGSAAERIAQLAQRGVPFEMSVGLYSYTAETVGAGKTVVVNGRTFAGPVNVLRNGQVREVSIVTLGADPRTTADFR